MSHDNRKRREREPNTPFKKPGNVIIVSNPENGKLKNGRYSRRPKKKNARTDRLRQTAAPFPHRPKEPAYDRIMEICGWMRDDGFVSDELHKDVYEPASKDDKAMLMKNVKRHMESTEPKLASYLGMLLCILEETDAGTSGAR